MPWQYFPTDHEGSVGNFEDLVSLLSLLEGELVSVYAVARDTAAAAPLQLIGELRRLHQPAGLRGGELCPLEPSRPLEPGKAEFQVGAQALVRLSASDYRAATYSSLDDGCFFGIRIDLGVLSIEIGDPW